MKRVSITYHMKNKTETAENVIKITLSDETADALLDGNVPMKIEFWLDDLAEMQGYDKAEFIQADIDERSTEDEA